MLSDCLTTASFLLPRKDADQSRWACIACDQHSSEPSYWEEMDRLVGDAPSTLHMILPECYLDETEQRIPKIQQTMQTYLQEGILQPTEKEGFILTARTTQNGTRLGLMALVDLEAYDYHKGSKAPIRASEETIEARIPPRVKIRRDAMLELPHVLLLMNDAKESVLEPFYAKRSALPQLYDCELLMDGGHLQAWGLFEEKQIRMIHDALNALPAEGGLLFAVGDGNHSLATAKACWEAVKAGLKPEQQLHHPARYAMVELVNIHSKALVFAPIHRVVFGADEDELMEAWQGWIVKNQYGNQLCGGIALMIAPRGERMLSLPHGMLEVAALQAFLDEWLAEHPECSIDYIHGDRTVRRIAAEKNGIAFLLPTPDRDGLFAGVSTGGSLPRKTFSMGSANEKRYYYECRKIVP